MSAVKSTYVVRVPPRRWAAGAVGAVLVGLLATGCARVPGTVTPAPPTTTGAADVGSGSTDRPAGGTSTTRGPHHPLDEATVVGFVEALNAALASGDVEQWMAHLALDEEGTAQQRDWYAGVHAVPMDVREMVATSVLGVDPERGQYVDVAFRHQVHGADAVPSLEHYHLMVHQDGEGGDLRVTNLRGREGYTSAYPQAWDLGPIEVHDGDAVVLLGSPEAMADAEVFLPLLEEGARSTLETFPVEGVDRMAVTLADEDDLALLHGEGEEVTELLGFVAPAQGSPAGDPGTVGDPADRDAVTARIVLAATYPAFETTLYDGIDGGSPLLRHEGLHLVMSLGAPDAWGPEWAFEGMATWWEHVGDETATADLYAWSAALTEDAGLEPSWPPSDYDEFFKGGGDPVDRHYVDAGLVFLYIEQQFGRETAIEVGTALHRIDGFGVDRLADEVLQEHLGLTQAQLQTDWESWADDLTVQ